MNEDLLELIEILGTRALQNSSRLSILIALYVLKKAIFSDIVRYTGQPKSSVYQSLQILEDEGLVMVRYAITFKGPRKVIEITSKGEYLVERLLELVSRLRTGGVAESR